MEVKLDPMNSNQYHEIGDIGWFTYEEVMKIIRPYHTNRIKIIMSLIMYMINDIINNNE